VHGAEVLLELGGVILGLGILGRLAGRLGLSAIPLYLLAGLAFGQGGLLPAWSTWPSTSPPGWPPGCCSAGRRWPRWCSAG